MFDEYPDTCPRIRRVKCDERRPFCERCTKSGRECDGYTPLGVMSLTTHVPGDQQERRGFHFFRSKSIGEILGQQDADSWNRLFLQASHSEPAIRHCLIAIASLHESLELSNYGSMVESNSVSQGMRHFSLRHYNKAIRRLVAETNEPNARLGTILVLCLLFIVFESFQSGYYVCSLHLQNGLAVLQQWRLSGTQQNLISTNARDLIDNQLTSIFNRMLAQATIFMDSRIHIMQMRKYFFTSSQPRIAKQFSSLAEARETLDSVITWTFYKLEEQHESSIQEVQELLKQILKDWLHAFQRLLASLAKLEPEDLRAARFLKVYYHISVIIIDVYLSADEAVYDRHVDRFMTIVKLAAETLHGSGAGDNQYKLNFSFDLGISPPLYFTASRCRDPCIRRAALALLRVSHRNQGCWNSEHSAKCADEIIKIEESGLDLVLCCKDVPEANRIRKVFADVQHENGHIKMLYVHAPYDLTSPVETAYISLQSDSAQEPIREVKFPPDDGSSRFNAGPAGDRYDASYIPSFVSKMYFPQETI